MSLESVTQHLALFGRADEIVRVPGSAATVELAAEAIGVPAATIAKTISVYSADRGHAILLVVAGDGRLVSGEFKRRFGHKPQFLSAQDVEPLTGHPIGGVCPFGTAEGAEVWLDESLRRFETVWPAAGAPDAAVGIRVDDLERISGARGWVAVTRLAEAETGTVGTDDPAQDATVSALSSASGSL